ncbi:MAG: sigma-70 family RNA polymerase sigma factor [Sulfitobacter sp.]
MRHPTLPQAITELMSDLRRYAMMLTRDHALRDDLVQETVLRALEKRELLKDQVGLRSWLFQIMRRRFIDLQRANTAREHREGALQWIESDHQPAQQDTQVRLSQLRSAFTQLPPDQRRALQLVAIDGLTCRDAADHEGIAVGTLLSRLARARQRLRSFEDPSAIQNTKGVQI